MFKLNFSFSLLLWNQTESKWRFYWVGNSSATNLYYTEPVTYKRYVFLYLIEQVNRQGNNGILVEYFFDCVIANKATGLNNRRG